LIRTKDPSCLWYYSTFLIVFISLTFLSSRPVYGIDFSYSGPDCRLLYRFIPRTGTLNDLTVIYNESFEFYPSQFGGILTFTLGGEYLHPQEGRHTSQVIEESISEDMYEAKFRWSYAEESFEFTIRMKLKEKTLSIEFSPIPRAKMSWNSDWIVPN